MFLPYHVRLPGSQGTLCSKQGQNLILKWLQQDSNLEALISQTNTQPSGETSHMVELCSEYLSVSCTWLYVLAMSRTSFRVNPHSWKTYIDICLNVKGHLALTRCEIIKLSDCNWTLTQNHLLRKRALNHLAKMAKWLSCFLSTYLYGAFHCMFLSCYVRISEWIHTL